MFISTNKEIIVSTNVFNKISIMKENRNEFGNFVNINKLQ